MSRSGRATARRSARCSAQSLAGRRLARHGLRPPGRRDRTRSNELRRGRSNLLFLLAVSCFWFGCNTAAKELVKERVIFLRERDFNLRVAGYFASKFLVLSLIGVLQASLLFRIVRAWCRPAGLAGIPVAHARRARVGRDSGRPLDLGGGPVRGGGDGPGADRGHPPDHPRRGRRSPVRTGPTIWPNGSSPCTGARRPSTACSPRPT